MIEDYQEFRRVAGHVFTATQLMQLANNPNAFYQLLQSSSLRRMLASAYAPDSYLDEGVKEVATSIVQELNLAISELQKLDFFELQEYCTVCLRTSTAHSAATFINDTLERELEQSRREVGARLDEITGLRNQIAELRVPVQIAQRDLKDALQESQSKYRRLEKTLEKEKAALHSSLRKAYRSVWVLVHGAGKDLPIGNLGRTVGYILHTASPDGYLGKPAEVSGHAVFVTGVGDVHVIPFAVSMRTFIAHAVDRNDEAYRPAGFVAEYTSALGRKIREACTDYLLVDQRPAGMLLGFCLPEDLQKSNMVDGGVLMEGSHTLLNFPLNLVTQREIVLKNAFEYGIVIIDSIRPMQPRFYVLKLERGGYLPNLFAVKSAAKKEAASPLYSKKKVPFVLPPIPSSPGSDY